MKTIKYFMISILTLWLSACHNDNNLSTNQPQDKAIQSFVIHTDDAEYHAAVDETTQEITISGLQRASKIKSISVKLAEGFSMQPDPNSIKKWHNSQSFYISGGGKQLKYTCNLPDLSELLDRTFIVMGYIRPNLRSFDNVLPTINFKNVTHIIASFAHAKSDGTLDVADLEKIGLLATAAREGGAKVLVSINRASAGEFATCINNASSRSKLVDKILNYVDAQNLDGFDIDFEDYGEIPASRDNLHLFAKELKEKKPEGILMTCAVSPYSDYGKGWGDYFDYVNVMSYDAFDGKQHASFNNYKWHMDYIYDSTSTPYERIVGGVPFYGYSEDNIPGKDGTNAVSYASILIAYKDLGAADKDQVNETYYNGRPTIRKKCQYAKEIGLAGIMIWDLLLDTDLEEYKLLNVVGEEMLPSK